MDQGEKILKSDNIDDFGRLLNEAWQEKKKLSNEISNRKIDELYNDALKYGALGGKLLGAGGGGFLLLYTPINKIKKLKQKLINYPFLNFNFEDSRTRITYYDEN